jgi:hypothetical protein
MKLLDCTIAKLASEFSFWQQVFSSSNAMPSEGITKRFIQRSMA